MKSLVFEIRVGFFRIKKWLLTWIGVGLLLLFSFVRSFPIILSIENPEDPLGLLELVTVVVNIDIIGGGEIGALGNGGIITEKGGDDLGGCWRKCMIKLGKSKSQKFERRKSTRAFVKFRFSKTATKSDVMAQLIWRLASKCQINWEISSHFCGPL